MHTTKSLRVGFARQCITPDYTVGISGYGDAETRHSEGVVDDIYLTCIAVTDGDDTILMYTADLLAFSHPVQMLLRERVTPVTGIPGDRIFCTATHSHSGPLLFGDVGDYARFQNDVLNIAVSVAQAALADRAPATMLSTVKEVYGLNFIRHYELEDGSYAGSNFGNWSLKLTGRHAAATDPRMVLVKFAREDKQDIVLMNWQAHNDNAKAVGYNFISSSYVGRVRAKFEQDTGMHFAFFMGASGNQNPNSNYNPEHHGLDWIAYGERIAQHAIDVLPMLTPVTGSGIRTKRVMLEYEVNHAWDHMLEQANEVFRVWKTEGLKVGNVLARSYGFSSVYQSRDILKRATMPATDFLELNAFRIGDMGFVTSTNEVFSTVGIHVRANSPFATTFILTGNHQYLPSAASYDYRSYEADTSMYAKGTAEKVADELVRMLHDVK